MIDEIEKLLAELKELKQFDSGPWSREEVGDIAVDEHNAEVRGYHEALDDALEKIKDRSNEMHKRKVETVSFDKGTILHYKGMPFECPKDVLLLGLNSNKDLADDDWKPKPPDPNDTQQEN